MNAGALVADIRAELAPVTEQILATPYLAALEEGGVPQEKLLGFAGQQRHIITSDLRSIALMASRYGGTPSRAFFLESLAVEVAALDALGPLARALGTSAEALAEVEPIVGAHAYTAYVAWMALYASEAEFAAAFLVNLPAWGANCGRVAAALRARYGFDDAAVAFFDNFAAPAPAFESAATNVIAGGLAAGVPPGLIRRAARLLQGYEALYWQSLYEDLKAPPPHPEEY
jgi:hypothetical protein